MLTRQLRGLVVEYQLAAQKVLQGSNPGWGAQEFSKLTFISRHSAACGLHATKKLEDALYQRASKSREETAIATVGKLISILHLVAGPRTRNVMMTSQSKKNDFFSSGTNLQMSPL